MIKNTALFIAFFSLISFNVFAANYSTKASGNWTANATWNDSRPSTNLNNDNVTINAGHDVVLNSNIDLKNKSRLTVAGKLTINGTFEAGNDLLISIPYGGELIINGSFVVQNNANVTIEGTATITGNMQFHTGASVTVNGSLGVGGNINGHNNNVISGTGTIEVGGSITGGVVVTGPSVLPVEMLSFSASIKNQTVLLQWQTASEINNDYFIVERSSDALSWESIGYVNGNGNSNSVISYSFNDNQPLFGVSYYRLKQIDFDGAFEYHGVIAVDFSHNSSTDIKLFQNSPNEIKISITKVVGRGQIIVSDLTGRIITSFTLEACDHANIVSIPLENTGSMVIVSFQDNNGLKSLKVNTKR